MKIVKIQDQQTSFLIKLTNFILRSKKINLNDITKLAEKRTGLSDWGNSSFQEAANILVDDINENSKLSGFGTYFTKQLLTKSISNLLEINHYTKNQKVELAHAPVIILGLPRTGSTFLFNVMARDPQFRSLNFWETDRFSPTASTLLKKIKGKYLIESTNWFAPQLRAIHEVRYEGPGECTQILTNSLKNISFGCYFYLPNYAPWVIQQNQVDTYENHKKQLFLLGKQDRWLLKAPPHLMTFKEILTVYPNAKIIQLHRDPVEVVGSASSLIAASRNLFTTQPILKITGKDISKILRWSLDKTIQERNDLKPKNIVDVMYRDLINDPMKTLKTIYTSLNINWNENLESTFKAEQNETKQHKFGKHIYDLQDYGLSKELIRDKFSSYIKHFNL